MTNISDYYSARKETLPFASGDTDILIDIDLTQYASAAAFAAANPAWTVGGTGAVFDANGFNGKGTAWLYTTTWADYAALASANQGTIIIEVEREALAMDEGIVAFAGTFIQSTGTAGSTRYLFQTQANVYNNYYTAVAYNSGNSVLVRSTVNSTANDYTTLNPNSQTPTGLDGYMQFALTWKNYEVYGLIDGMPVSYKYQAGPHTNSTEFQRIVVGASTTAGASPLGDYYIRRIQVVKRAAFPVYMPMRIAVFGDSYMYAATDNSNRLTRQSVVGWADGTGRSGQYCAMGEFSRLCNANGLGIPYLIYGTGTTETGHGWAADKLPFSASTKTAVVTANPEIIICAGSVNDVDTTLPADILGDTQAIMDTFIDGCSNLREIHYFEMFPGQSGDTSENTQTKFDNSATIRQTVRGIDGYRDKVIYHSTREHWDESYGSYAHPEYTIGTAPTNTKTANADRHPSTLGYLKMGEIIFNAMLPYLKNPLR